MTSLQKHDSKTALTQDVAALVERAKAYFDASLSENTRTAYASRWASYQAWAVANKLPFRPDQETAETVALFVTHLAEEGRAVSTVQQYLAAISLAHRGQDRQSPTTLSKIKQLVKGIKNAKGAAPSKKKAVTVEDVKRMVKACLPTPKGKRDRAMLLFGFVGALRRSELVGIHVEHIEVIKDGLKVLIPKSKTDQEGRGRHVTLPFGGEACPGKALKAWLNASGITEGPLFRRTFPSGRVGDKALTPRTVAMIIKEYANEVGLDANDFSGHSLRSGYVTEAVKRGAADHEVMAQTGHKSVQVLHGYKQHNPVVQNNPAKKFDL